MRRNVKQLSVSIEGIIGSGKTSIVWALKKDPTFEVFEEPVAKWQNYETEEGTRNLLQEFYDDPIENLMPLQWYIRHTFLDIHDKPFYAPLKIMERSVFSANTFMEVSLALGNCSIGKYRTFHDWQQDSYLCPTLPDMYVYLKVSPETALRRVRARGRQEERSVDLKYLTLLEQAHTDWLIHRETKPVFVVNAEKPLLSVLDVVQFFFHKLHDQITDGTYC